MSDDIEYENIFQTYKRILSDRTNQKIILITIFVFIIVFVPMFFGMYFENDMLKELSVIEIFVFLFIMIVFIVYEYSKEAYKRE